MKADANTRTDIATRTGSGHGVSVTPGNSPLLRISDWIRWVSHGANQSFGVFTFQKKATRRRTALPTRIAAAGLSLRTVGSHATRIGYSSNNRHRKDLM